MYHETIIWENYLPWLQVGNTGTVWVAPEKPSSPKGNQHNNYIANATSNNTRQTFKKQPERRVHIIPYKLLFCTKQFDSSEQS